MITVKDLVPPALNCKSIPLILGPSSTASIVPTDVFLSGSDNCGTVNLVSVNPNTFGCLHLGANTVLLQATDGHGNSTACSATVSVSEKSLPSVSCKPASVSLNQGGAATLPPADVFLSGSDNCGTVTPQSVSPASFNCSNIGTNTVTLTVTDNNGNTNSCTATVTVQDKVVPQAVCKNTTIQLDATGNASLVTSAVNNNSTDACGIAALALSKSAFDCTNTGANTVTLTVTDNNSNSAACTATVTVQDNVVPAAACQNTTIQLDATGNASLTTSAINNGSTDACGIASLALSKTTFDCSNTGANTVTLTVTDNNGNTNSCSASVTVQDNVVPAAICKNATIQLDASGNATLATSAVNNGSTDACGIAALALSKTAFDCSNTGANTVTLTATDNNGNTAACTATVTVQDNVVPQAVCKNATIQLDASGNATLATSAVNNGSADACSIAALALSKTAFNCSNTGTNTVTLTVTDNNSNTASCTATVTVRDLILPSFTSVPANVVVQCQAVPAVGTAVATDNCGASVVYNGQTISSVSCTDTYVITRKWTATDPSGNTRTATQLITVRDIQAPAFTASPANITVQCSNIPAPGMPTASDNCDASVAITYNGETRTNGACTDTYILTRKWTAADNCGNTRSVTQRISVQDTQKPVFTATPQNLTLQCSDNLPAIATPTATDNCDASVTVAFLGETTANASCAGNYQVLRIWTATDNCGNSTAFTQTISIQDNQAPVFTSVPQHLTIQCSDLVPAIGQATASDACGGYVQVLFQGQTLTPGNCPANRTILRTWLAQDDCGNTATATQTISIQDTQAPAFSNAPANITIACGATVPGVPAVLAIDNCDTYVPVTYLGESSTGNNCPYTITRSWTVADDCGNATTLIQTISVGVQNAGGTQPEERSAQTNTAETEVRLFPNPATDEVWISLNSDTEARAELLFFSAEGRLALRQQVTAQVGENQFQIPLTTLPTGVYALKVLLNGKTSTRRLVVAKD